MKRAGSLRLSVRAFAEDMEAILSQNDYKGGWENATVDFCLCKLAEEFAEVVQAIKHRAGGEEVRRECVDLANVAMALSEHYPKEVQGKGGDSALRWFRHPKEWNEYPT